jgi:uncharacterized membrane protein YidH (DUF202 family)
MRINERFAPIAAVATALGALACCLPLGIAGAVAALGLSVAIETMRPWLIGLAVVLLGVGFFQMYRRQKSCQRRSKLSIVLFLCCAVIVVTILLFPQQVAVWMATLDQKETP